MKTLLTSRCINQRGAGQLPVQNYFIKNSGIDLHHARNVFETLLRAELNDV